MAKVLFFGGPRFIVAKVLFFGGPRSVVAEVLFFGGPRSVVAEVLFFGGPRSVVAEVLFFGGPRSVVADEIGVQARIMKSASLKYFFASHCRRALVLVALFFPAFGFFAGETLAVETTGPVIRSAAEIDYPPFSITEILLYTGLIVGSLVLLLLFIFFLWWWSLRKQVAQKTLELKESEEKYRLLAEHSEDIIFTLDTELKYTYVSPAVKTLRGYAPAELIGKPIDQSLTSDSLSLAAKTFSEEFKKANEKGPASRTARILELQMNCKDGSRIWAEVKASFLRDRDGNITGILGVTRDISERKKAEQALRQSEERLQAILESSADPLVVYDVEGVPQYLNPAFVKVFGWTLDELKERRIPFVLEDQKEITAAKIEEIYATGEPVKFVSRRLTREGSTLDVIVSAAIVKDDKGQGAGMVVNLTDITEQRKLEIQLRQAQKMESVGRLAGGVAHDYNNMLSVILGYTEMALDQVPPDDPLHEDLSEVLTAARRSADITRQLLAFSRQQTVSPKVLDINETVEATLKMLRRLTGEDIDLFWKPGKSMWPVKMDPAQLDQILANLCVNARDAIAGIGKITIETGTAVFNEAYCAHRGDFIPGEYTILAVSDDGCGMNKETLVHLFEPFFTTKGRAEGTGMGLATVYGIVKQNRGHINVYSEPGEGTTFRIYLPRYTADTEEGRAKSSPETLTDRDETILLVEDEPSILKIGKKMLESLGYTVLASEKPKEAEALAQEYTGDIHLLITDVVMPQMNGRELAERLQGLYPDLKVLFMSGYTADAIAHRGVLEEGVFFMQKPFTKEEMAEKVREALEG